MINNYGASTVGNVMIKCLECGFETENRLQWTHFKYKCTGRFRNGEEYKKVFPGAKIVSDDLAKRTAITENNLILKYGKEEGNQKWAGYKEKQALKNTLNYKKEKYGWSEKDFEQYNKLRSCTLENFIQRHGEDEGLKRWVEYCERQRYTSSKEYFVGKYGNDGIEKWEVYCKERAKSTSIEYIMKSQEIGRDIAIKVLSDRLSGNCVSEGEKEFISFVSIFLEDIDYTYKTKQFCIWSDLTDGPLFYDLVSVKRNKIIEYNGDYWHANPALYEDSFVLKQSGLTAKEIREKDYLKIKTAEERGFDIFVVWENEFIQNPENVKEKLIKWWYNG